MTPPTESRRAFPMAAVIVLMVVAGGAGAFWLYLRQSAGPPGPPGLTPEAKSYVRSLKLGDVEIRKTESYLAHAIVEITGKITNAGERPLAQVELNCVFYDPYGQLVLRHRVAIV
ncbi:MAG: hypothetical protein ACRD44_00145, partial [Bryobacteraceae bacterium]